MSRSKIYILADRFGDDISNVMATTTHMGVHKLIDAVFDIVGLSYYTDPEGSRAEAHEEWDGEHRDGALPAKSEVWLNSRFIIFVVDTIE